MEAPTPAKPISINRLLPYWAVFQADVRQTLQSWVYRTWVLISILAAVGFLLYRLGVYKEAKIVQQASSLMGELLRWSVLGSVTLIIMLTASSISSDRGTLADSVLCRGISRYQYFFAKWHARLVTVLGTFLLMGLALLIGSFFLLEQDLSIPGSIVALLTVAIMLGTVITCGVTFSAITNSTVMGITVLWLFIYGLGFTLSLLPTDFPSPSQTLNRLPYMLQGKYDLRYLGQMAMWSAVISFAMALVGLGYFAQRDV
ncbi:MAG: ABC transporter permease [Gemmataceae bacterium]|nr:ABC transporter permease [Gemmataceae bacterium]